MSLKMNSKSNAYVSLFLKRAKKRLLQNMHFEICPFTAHCCEGELLGGVTDRKGNVPLETGISVPMCPAVGKADC